MSRGARDVPEIAEAIALFESWEKSINDYAAARHFTQAMQLLDDYLEAEPQTPHRQFVHNLKTANTRSLVQQLARVERKDFGLWLEYALFVVSLAEKQPALKKDLEAFLGVWGDAVAQALQRAQRIE